jgi:hypothetical protein
MKKEKKKMGTGTGRKERGKGGGVNEKGGMEKGGREKEWPLCIIVCDLIRHHLSCLVWTLLCFRTF